MSSNVPVVPPMPYFYPQPSHDYSAIDNLNKNIYDSTTGINKNI